MLVLLRVLIIIHWCTDHYSTDRKSCHYIFVIIAYMTVTNQTTITKNIWILICCNCLRALCLLIVRSASLHGILHYIYFVVKYMLLIYLPTHSSNQLPKLLFTVLTHLPWLCALHNWFIAVLDFSVIAYAHLGIH